MLSSIKINAIILLIAMLFSTAAFAQKQGVASYELGTGLSASSSNSNYSLKLTGMMQPYFSVSSTEDTSNSENTIESRSAIRRGRIVLIGNAKPEKISFFLQTEFVSNQPLLDAFITYSPKNWLDLHFGQKMVMTNNREMVLPIFRTQFTDRSLLTTTFTTIGRETGIFADLNFQDGQAIFKPQLSITTGDGRNAWIVNQGGYKFGMRLDVMPFGDFKDGLMMVADLAHEETLKVLLGVAGSINRGANHAKGEGSNGFRFYDNQGDLAYPNLGQYYADVILKYQGFSAMLEFAQTTASNYDDLYINRGVNLLVVDQTIGNYLALGSALNLQAGYASENGIGFDVRFTNLSSDQDDQSRAVLKDTKELGVSLSKYLKGNSAKFNLAYNNRMQDGVPNVQLFELMMQVVF